MIFGFGAWCSRSAAGENIKGQGVGEDGEEKEVEERGDERVMHLGCCFLILLVDDGSVIFMLKVVVWREAVLILVRNERGW